MSFIEKLLFQIPILLITLTIHEYSHGRVAYLLGDDTAKRAGRLTLNPLTHIDPLGLLMLFVVHIGWAKPVPINPYNFKNYKRDTAITAAAGPAANFILAIVLSVILRVYMGSLPGLNNVSGFQQFIFNFLFYAIMINLALGIFNLIPLPPLDGSKIIGGFLTDAQYSLYAAKEREGAMILMLLFAVDYFLRLGMIGRIIRVPLYFFLQLLTGIEI